MQSPWQTFLSQIGAQLREDLHCDIDQASNVTGDKETHITPLSHYGLLVTQGPDSAKFLQGQSTCDTRELEKQLAKRGSFCSQKGRMFSSFLAASANSETIVLRMSRDITQSSQQALNKYLAFFKAEQTDISDDYILLGLNGPKAQHNIKHAFGNTPTSAMSTVKHQQSIAIQLDEQAQLFECWIHHEDIDTLWPKLSEETQLTPSKNWQLAVISQGIGEVTANTSDLFIPQMLNHQATEAISFTKGCFTGQEIVARMQYKGKVKRRMYRIDVPGKRELPAGAEIFMAGKAQNIGHIVSASYTQQHNTQALVVLTKEAAEQKTLNVGKNNASDEISLTILDLPYLIDENQE